jgi:hypothetical protein
MKQWKKNRHGSNDTTATALPLVAFGAGLISTNHNHIHGYPVGSTNLIRNHMLQRQRRALCIVGHTNEYLTSQVSTFLLFNIPSALSSNPYLILLCPPSIFKKYIDGISW